MTKTNPIPMVDLRTQYLSMREEINQAVLDVIDSCAFILGPNVAKFEQEAAQFLHCDHAVSCASGTDALHLALRALDIGAGDEVITPAFTFAATAEAITYVSATPVFCDIESTTFNIDVDQVEALITPRTKAIIAVHLYGHPADLNHLRQICDKYKLELIEDCAQSFGAHIDQRATGSIGSVGCFSFFPSKNLGAYGDGGLLTTQSEELAERFKLLRNHGSRQRYHHEEIGFNSRLDEIQAAILRVKLKHIKAYNQGRQNAAMAYTKRLGEIDGITTPVIAPGYDHVFHQYTILTERRDRISAALVDQQIGHAIYYPIGLHQQAAFKSISQTGSLPVTERVCEQCLSLPMYPELEPAQIDTICDVIQSAVTLG